MITHVSTKGENNICFDDCCLGYRCTKTSPEVTLGPNKTQDIHVFLSP